MAIFGFFKTQRPRQFNLKYRYYDEQKERLRESEERVRKKLGLDKDGNKNAKYSVDPERIRGSMRGSLEDSRQKKRNNVRYGIFIGFILICLYLFYHYVL